MINNMAGMMSLEFWAPAKGNMSQVESASWWVFHWGVAGMMSPEFWAPASEIWVRSRVFRVGLFHWSGKEETERMWRSIIRVENVII